MREETKSENIFIHLVEEVHMIWESIANACNQIDENDTWEFNV